jgi:hypothetical protein
MNKIRPNTVNTEENTSVLIISDVNLTENEACYSVSREASHRDQLAF